MPEVSWWDAVKDALAFILASIAAYLLALLSKPSHRQVAALIEPIGERLKKVEERQDHHVTRTEFNERMVDLKAMLGDIRSDVRELRRERE